MPENELQLIFGPKRKGRKPKNAPMVPAEVVKFAAQALMRKEGFVVSIQELDLWVTPVFHFHGNKDRPGLLLAMDTGGCMRYDPAEPLEALALFENRFPMSQIPVIQELFEAIKKEMELQHVALPAPKSDKAPNT